MDEVVERARVRRSGDFPIRQVTASAYAVPTDFPESDGTIAWNQTTIVVVEVEAGGERGLGYTYADAMTARFIQNTLGDVVANRDAMAVGNAWLAMIKAVRNIGRPGMASMAIAAVDNALWDLKARLLDLPLATLLGQVERGVAAYGSGGFTSYSLTQLGEQLGGWAAEGLHAVKMKVGRQPGQDAERVRAARAAIGPDVALYVDANGAYTRKEALAFADVFAESNVGWFEEPVSSDDIDGLTLIRNRAPAGMDIAAGEYGYDLWYFERLLAAGAVDVLQADATRCAGISGFLEVGALCAAHHLQLSAHTSPSLHVHPACALRAMRNIEYFHDHARIEHLFFDGAATPQNGLLAPDLSRPGLGLVLKRADAARYAVG
jgi:L-alanine-DL-glutamate epimerase-like enolase superfamily enzyme